jgi:hypothetical protein
MEKRTRECLDGREEVRYRSFNDSFFSLRRCGWIIESRRVRGGTWQFRLVGKNEKTPEHRPMTRPQQLIAKSYVAAIRKELGEDAVNLVTAALDRWLRLPNDLVTDAC